MNNKNMCNVDMFSYTLFYSCSYYSTNNRITIPMRFKYNDDDCRRIIVMAINTDSIINNLWNYFFTEMHINDQNF